jgi:UDP-N-acetylglucosamine--N-acetylmuramyl-(pentapeptide) pyrophosphoryl-undecaprenol N-acetylglucosamine transferase
MRLMITGGGTAGHTSPAVAIFEELQKRDSALEVQWVGRRGSIEERVCATLSIPFRPVAVRGWPRAGLVGRARALVQLAMGIAQAFLHLRRFRPQAVLGVGGYVSVPVVWVAQRLGVPTILHEQNTHLGMANRLLGARATRLLLSFPNTTGHYPKERAVVVGNPVRAGFVAPVERESALERLGLEVEAPLVLVVGGSQGARTLNDAMPGALKLFRAGDAQFIWMTGKSGLEAARKAAVGAEVAVRVTGYIDDMATACAAATLIVSRAGASSTAEIAALGKPSILVPYRHATDNHQETNARAFEQAGAAVVILDSECTAGRLADEMRGLLSAPKRMLAMGEAARSMARPAAVENIVETILAAAFFRESKVPD